MTDSVIFCATAKTGLGHLRRSTNIAAALHERNRDLPLTLCSNAPVAGLAVGEAAYFSNTVVQPRAEMAAWLADGGGDGPVVVDTAVLPGLHRVARPLCLVLRATVADKVTRFALEDGRTWDLVCVPNPASRWLPDGALLPARRIEAVGWIYRRPEATAQERAGTPRLLVAAGGGGGADAGSAFGAAVDALVAKVRAALPGPLDVILASGPRADGDAAITGADRVLDADPDLHQAFAGADLVISTAGYNSVLELACTDVPVLFVPIARTYDDQAARARYWAPRLGLCHEPSDPGRSAAWMTEVLRSRRRRAPADPGPSGAAACAGLIEGLMA